MNIKNICSGRTVVFHCRAFRWMALCAWLALPLAKAGAQTDLFIKFTPRAGDPAVPGDSMDRDYPANAGWFQIQNFSLGTTNSTTINTSGGAASGRSGFLQVNFGKFVNSASPALFQALTSGRSFETAQLVVRQAPARQAFLSYEFKLVVMNAQDWAGATSGPPFENIRFQHGAFRLTYRPQDSAGALGAPIVAVWDQVANLARF